MKTIWKPLKGAYEQIKFDTVKLFTQEDIFKTLTTRFNLTDFASMSATALKLQEKEGRIECVFIRDDVNRHPKLSHHEKVKYLISIYFRKVGTDDILPFRNFYAIEMQNNPTIDDVRNIIETYFLTPDIFVAFYLPQKLSRWMLTATDKDDYLIVKYAADLAV